MCDLDNDHVIIELVVVNRQWCADKGLEGLAREVDPRVFFNAIAVVVLYNITRWSSNNVYLMMLAGLTYVQRQLLV